MSENEEYTWTDNPMEAGVADCDPDVVNENLMHLKYNHKGGGGGLPPSICNSLTITRSGQNVTLKWQDPNNTILDNQYLCTWDGTKIVKKAGSYPTDEKDGEVVVDNTVHNQYLKNGYVDTIAEDDENTYYYTAFPYSTNGVYCYNPFNQFKDAIVYEYCDNPNESNPALKITYPNGSINADFEAAGMDFDQGTFNYGSWENAFFQPRPVMLKYDGTVDYELYKPDFKYRADGQTLSDVSNADYQGNAMIGFPQVWFKFAMTNGLKHVYIANCQVDEDYHCFTHINKNGELLPEIYVMAFQPANINSVARSLAGKTILTNNAGTTEITNAQNNGACWGLMDYGEVKMIEYLLHLMGKSTDAQAVYGKGRDSNNPNATTGEALAKGMFYGTKATGMVKIFGIENYYGNYWKRINGCVYTTAGMRYKLCDYTADGSTVIGYNTNGDGYLTHQTFTGSSGGYISQTLLTPVGIFPTVASGSATTHYPDGLWWANGGFALVGGCYYDGALSGASALSLSAAVGYAYAYFGGSLSCKPL